MRTDSNGGVGKLRQIADSKQLRFALVVHARLRLQLLIFYDATLCTIQTLQRLMRVQPNWKRHRDW